MAPNKTPNRTTIPLMCHRRGALRWAPEMEVQ